MRALSRLGLSALIGLSFAWPAFARSASGQDASPVATPVVVERCDQPIAGGGSTPVAEADVDPTALDLDVLYIDILVPHHESAVTMAGIAQARSTRPEVVSLAAGMVARQSSELEQLRTWRESWYPDVPALTETQLFAGLETKASSPGRGGAPGLDDLTMTGMAETIAELCSETDLLDLAFIDHMVEHHTGAVLISELVAVEAVHPELAVFARTVVDTQGAEIATMLSWRDAWYGGYPSDHHVGDEGTPES